MTKRRTVSFIFLFGAGMFSADAAWAETKLLWERAVSTNSTLRVDETGERILIKSLFDKSVHAYDRHGNLVWEARSDSCFSASRDLRRVWVAQGDYGLILDGDTGRKIVKSRALRGLKKMVAWHSYCLPTLGPHALSPDGKTFFSEYFTCEEGCLEYENVEAMVVDAETGKLLWRKKYMLALGEMPDDGSFWVNQKGMFSRDGKVLWVYKDEFNKWDELYPDKLWMPPGFNNPPGGLSQDGKYMWTWLEVPPHSESGTSYLMVNPGDPGKAWEMIPWKVAGKGRVSFSPDHQYVLKIDGGSMMWGQTTAPKTKVYLQRMDGSLVWSKEIDDWPIAQELGPKICAEGTSPSLKWRIVRAEFLGDNILVQTVYFTDIYDLEGRLIKRIIIQGNPSCVPPGGHIAADSGCTQFFRILPDGRYFVIERGYRDAENKTDKLKFYEGRLDEPDI